MRLTEVETFRAVMQAGSTRKAAALLSVTQPAVSQSIKRMEAEAGFLLFARLRGRLVATPEAFELLTEVERAFVGLSAIEHRLKTLREFGVNRLELACYPAFGLGFMPRALAALAASKYGRAQVSLQVLSSTAVRDRVAAGHADFGLMADEAATSGLQHSVFAPMTGVVVMRPDHAMAQVKAVTLAQLAQAPFIALNPEDTARTQLEATMAEHGLKLNVVVHTPYAASVCELALAGLGVGVVNPITALDYARCGLAVRPLRAGIAFTCLLVMPPAKVLSLPAQALLVAMRCQLQADLERIKQLTS